MVILLILIGFSFFMLTFFSHIQAAEHFGCEARKAKRVYFNKEYVLNKSIEYNPRVIRLNCKKCGKECLRLEVRYGNCNSCKKAQKDLTPKYCRICNVLSCKENKVNAHLYCKSCSSKGIGRQNQAKIVSKKYKGEGNPNFTNGLSVKNLWQDAKWTKLRKNYPNKICAKCASTKSIHLHHIVPQGFLTLQERYNLDNIIPLCELHHKELHHLQLDIVLLPILYQQYKKDARELQQLLCSQPEFQSMSYEGDEKYYKLSLIRLVPKNYHKILLNLHPEFVAQEFPHLV